MRHLFNGLHHPQAGLHTELLFEEKRVHSLGPVRTSQLLASATSLERCTASNFCFRTSMVLGSSRTALIVPIDSSYEYKAIFPCIGIHKPRHPHSFFFFNHFIIISVCFGINYHDNVKDFGRTCGRRLYYGGKDYKGKVSGLGEVVTTGGTTIEVSESAETAEEATGAVVVMTGRDEYEP
ncbi:hypothetical protein DVH24_002529 [Malus domestica]|uniref:Uncharacterized protein n=1 Tax=Malus domestica TaxID=3750 RepID=A0A498IVS7_MALDO|nr:hypothetical protein DVH24_002529 [Malus domestica]